jgi:hypothetical protein
MSKQMGKKEKLLPRLKQEPQRKERSDNHFEAFAFEKLMVFYS